MKHISFFIFLFFATYCMGQNMTANKLIQLSQKYHDPDNKLMNSYCELELNEPRKENENRPTYLTFDPANNYFKMCRLAGEERVIMSLDASGEINFLDKNGKIMQEVNREDEEKLRDRVPMMKNYFSYLWFMPMKLNDPGTIIDPQVKQKDFFGKSSLEIKVTYAPEVGEDIWYFYFDPSSYAMVGYRFYHDEAANDGEYILIDGEVEFDNVKIPKTRKWYTHKEDKYLGTDILVSGKLE